MNIETRFHLGQHVWGIYSRRDTVELPCGFCRGRGSVRVESPSGLDYEYAPCPRCGRRGTVAMASIPLWEANERAYTIGQVRVTISRYGTREEEREDLYMCVETGVGSGRLHKAEELFPTIGEASAEAEYRNGEIARGERWRPERREVEIARAFLDHLDVYEHGDEHVAMAQQLVAAYEAERVAA